jgi:hypothetical protein
MNTDLSDIIEKGLVPDLFKAERAYYIYKEIGKYADTINTSQSSIKQILIVLQSMSFSEAILSLARIYDEPHNKYPTRCIKQLIKILYEPEKNGLTTIKEKFLALSEIQHYGIPKYIEEYLHNDEAILFAKNLAQHIESELIQPEFIEILNEIKDIRDKYLAHNESIVNIKTVTWKNFDYLIEFVQMIIGIVGWAFFTNSYSMKGDYKLSKESKLVSYNIKNTLIELGIIPKEKGLNLFE